jgi:hypothetical protein
MEPKGTFLGHFKLGIKGLKIPDRTVLSIDANTSL